MGTNRFYKLWIEKATVQATSVGPKSWGSEEGLYSQEVEDAFEKIETKLARLYRKFESGSDLNDDERYGWAMWLLASYLRTPAAFLCSAEVGTMINGFTADLFSTSYEVLAKYVTNPYCIELIANRDWQLLTCEGPYFLKPDSGVVLTDRLDKDDCLILYPLSPVSCFVATGNGRSFGITSVQMERVFALNNDILRWSDNSVACTTQFWNEKKSLLRDAVHQNLGRGKFWPPISGRFFVVDGVECDGEIRATLLAPRGPTVVTIPTSAIRPVDGVQRPKIPGLYDVEDAPSIAVGVRYSDDESEINYAAAAQLMMQIGQRKFATDFARKALEKDKRDLLSKLVVLTNDPDANVGDLIPKNANEAAELAIWWALEKSQPLEGLKISSKWLRDYADHERLAQANFLCALLVYRGKLFAALCGSGEKLPYLDDSTPLPDGVIDLVKRAYATSDTGIVSEVQSQLGKMDVKASGLTADILRVCGLNHKLRLYRKA
jgi:hypothetical protein